MTPTMHELRMLLTTHAPSQFFLALPRLFHCSQVHSPFFQNHATTPTFTHSSLSSELLQCLTYLMIMSLPIPSSTTAGLCTSRNFFQNEQKNYRKYWTNEYGNHLLVNLAIALDKNNCPIDQFYYTSIARLTCCLPSLLRLRSHPMESLVTIFLSVLSLTAIPFTKKSGCAVVRSMDPIWPTFVSNQLLKWPPKAQTVAHPTSAPSIIVACSSTQ